jgi:hypothetical protein
LFSIEGHSSKFNRVLGFSGFCVYETFPDVGSGPETDDSVGAISIVEPVIGRDLVNSVHLDEFAIDFSEAEL